MTVGFDMAAGVDGFMLDNFEIVGHAPSASDGPCNAACSQGGVSRWPAWLAAAVAFHQNSGGRPFQG